MAPIFAGRQREPHDSLLFTFYGKNNALRSGDWKLVNINHGPWELYNVQEDRTELSDLSTSRPEQFRQMKGQWQALAKEVGAEPCESPSPDGLSMLVGSADSWLVLFPGRNS